ncbi:hypothetical protein SAMN05216354_0380 [Xylanibacter ruminicola]|uniref:Uncharacterized protein n=1 Tax=Xylanibacter ruminicola TaxID=839 RepID=A0A1H5RWL6_XYLRU|nr:hypothetical protein [Xylanibacter ruminicola]SEF42732.1 hypothetical protein SAMN05216354_0380 [Xylanibacter ruminicola]
MEHQQYSVRRVCSIRVEPYLATYARAKFEIDSKTGGIKIPDTFDLYHCVWQLMERRPRGAQLPEEPNLTIWLPFRRTVPSKHPEYWNYISPHNARLIERSLRRLFNWEFHHWCEELVAGGSTRKDAVDAFIRRYGLGIDCNETLLKNLQRHEASMRVFLGIKKSKKKKNRHF